LLYIGDRRIFVSLISRISVNISEAEFTEEGQTVGSEGACALKQNCEVLLQAGVLKFRDIHSLVSVVIYVGYKLLLRAAVNQTSPDDYVINFISISSIATTRACLRGRPYNSSRFLECYADSVICDSI
jgi:hypothetical protein